MTGAGMTALTGRVLPGVLAAAVTGAGLLSAAPGGVVAGPAPAITAGGDFWCALRAGKAYCAGGNDEAELGDNSNTGSGTPVPVFSGGVLAGKTLTRVSAGNPFACAHVSAGAAYCWGNNGYGQQANNSTAQSRVPVAADASGVLAGKKLAQISASDVSTCACSPGRPGQPWRLAQAADDRPGCGRALPAAPIRVASNLHAPAACQATASPVQRAADSALSEAGAAQTVAQSVADIALSQVGVSTTPAVTNFGTVDCDPYTTLVGPPHPNGDGCGFGQKFKVENENEAWCSDFSKWVWQQAGITTDMNVINAGADSFYDWGLDQGEAMPADAGTPAAGDAVVFFPPGPITPTAFADHVGIVTAVNPDGTVNLVNGDFLGASDISVLYNTGIRLTSWASQVWNQGEQWVLVTPPTTQQQPVPAAAISGPRLAVAGTAAGFTARAAEPGGSVTQYLWTFGDGGTATGATDSMEPHVYFRATDGDLAETYLSGGAWATRTLAGRPASGSAIVATTTAASETGGGPAVFYFNAAGHLAESYQHDATWTATRVPSPPTMDPGSLALTDAARSGGGRRADGRAALPHRQPWHPDGDVISRPRVADHADPIQVRGRNRQPNFCGRRRA